MHKLERRILLPQDLKPLNNIQEYKAQGGLKGLEKARSMKPQDVINEVKKSGLRGRGGAGFPTAIKWQTVADDPAAKKFVVCNMAEGEPGTYKDRYLISKNPYLVLEGMLIVAYAIDAQRAILGTKSKFKKTVERLQNALKEFEDEGVIQPGYLEIVLGPDEYLLGEEKALLEVIDGRPPMPRLFPPFMMGVGIGPTERNPAVVNNAESMSHLPNIFTKGADWFRSLGSEDTPGTIMISLSGDVKTPGMFEVEAGKITVRQMLFDLGGGPRGKDAFKAVFSGVANRVLTPDQFDLKMDFGTMRTAGVGVGSAGFMVYDESRSMVNLAWLFSKFLAKSSCGQCVPCNSGTRNITEILEKMLNGEAREDDIDEIMSITGRCTSQTRCFLPQQEANLISSIIQKFPQEFKDCIKQSCGWAEDLIIPKLADFDETARQFVYETHPIEFADV